MTATTLRHEGRRARIERGAARLDEKVPHWRKRIIRPLNMGSSRFDILGQVYGAFHLGVHALGLHREEEVTHGFRSNGTERYKALTAEWVAFLG